MDPKRYLMYFSYIGTQFRGAQRQVSRSVLSRADPSTIQGLIEYALTKLKPLNPVIFTLSSRTDQGVHALRTSGSVDLAFHYPGDPLYMLNFLNGFFEETHLDIRILEVLPVSKEFNPRSLPLWRKYIYRFATVKPNSDLPRHLIQSKLLPIPITENNRCYFIPSTDFDMDALNEATKLFIGTKDFLAFMGKNENLPEDFTTIRRIDKLYVEPAQPLIPSPFDNYYQYWHLTCIGKSFLYKQIRRMISVLTAVAQKQISINTIEKMIEEPSPHVWPNGLRTAPSGGLYLADVHYDPKDLKIPENEKTEQPELDEELSAEEKKTLIKVRLKKYQDNRINTS